MENIKNESSNNDEDVLGHQKRDSSRRRKRSGEDQSSSCSTCQKMQPQRKKLKRTVMNAAEEASFVYNPLFLPFLLHFYIAKELFHRNVGKNSNDGLPRKTVKNHHDAIDSIVYLENQELMRAFEEKKIQFEEQGKVDKYGNATEKLLFHGTCNESINKIAEDNFSLSALPEERGKIMLFGRGMYFSELPGVSLMYGDKLLVCKVLLGKSQKYFPNGNVPPEIPEEFDSRIVIKDGLEVVTVIKSPSQILPYCMINLKENVTQQAGHVSKPSVPTSSTTTTKN